jgi:hypothetical protein
MTRYCVMEDGACRYAAGSETLEPGEALRAVAVDEAYVRTNGPVIRDRLTRAGVRLADLLDRVLGED